MRKLNKYLENILTEYFPLDNWSISAGGNGVNNTTRFIGYKGQKYVLRIYETHKDRSKVEYEHSVLMAMKNAGSPLLTPEPVQTKKGSTIAETEDGKLAALFKHIEGSNPTLEEPGQLGGFGRATAQLTLGLAEINTALEPAYRPYYEIENTHPRCSLPYVIDLCANPGGVFLKHSDALAQIGEQLVNIRESMPKFKELPQQLIHGDLNASNVLADSAGQVYAILDFEFVTRDLRVMELAVCLSDLMHSSNDEDLIWERVGNYLTGYGSILKLSADEISVVPLLILLRRLDVFIHFLGRYLDGVNDIDIVEDQICKTAAQAGWIACNREKLIKAISAVKL